MEKKWFILLLMGILAVGMLAMGGCDDDDDDVTAPTIKPEIFGMIFNQESGPRKAEGDPAYAYIKVGNVGSVPECTINGVEMGLEPELTIYGSGAGFYGQFELGADNAATLAVDAGTAGSASVTINVPGTFDVVGSSDVDVIPFNSQEFDWTASDGAEVYWVRADFEVNYTDLDGNSQYWERMYTVFTTETEITFTAAQIFPDPALVDVVTNLWGDLDVMAVAGPIQPGDAANVTGDCTGFVMAVGAEIDWDIDDATPIAKTRNDREQEIDLMNDFVELMR